jgi:hypothetical protein
MLLKRLEPGDVLVVMRLDRLAHSSVPAAAIGAPR